MSVLVTESVVLHSFNYLENSRIYRLFTRDAGLLSVLARGARNSRVRFGSALGLFARGVATIAVKDGRELHTLSSFDITNAHGEFASDYDRFLGASLLAELVLRFGRSDAGDDLFEVLTGAMDNIAKAPPARTDRVVLCVGWRMVTQMGFGPSLNVCVCCHSTLKTSAAAPFNHRLGGVMCAQCARGQKVDRQLPASARATIVQWLAEEEPLEPRELSGSEIRSHGRLLREFVAEHLAEDRPLQAFSIWEESRTGRL